MKNIVNCYELDFVRDIPNEIITSQQHCETLTTSNKNLKFVLFFLILGFLICYLWAEKNHKKQNLDFN